MFENLTNKDIAILILFFVILIVLWINRIWRRKHNKEPGLKEIVEAAKGRDFNAEMQKSESENSENQENSAEQESSQKSAEKSAKTSAAQTNQAQNFDYEKEFFERTQNGEKSVLLKVVPSLQECKILQSVLYSAEIPSFAQTEKLSGIFGNTSGLPNTIFSVKLNVLESDQKSAQEILESKSLETEENK